MARQKGSANFAGNLEVLAGGPLDAREKVPTLADLTAAGTFDYPYEGMKTYVAGEKKYYMLTDEDPTDGDNWEELGGGTDIEDLTPEEVTAIKNSFELTPTDIPVPLTNTDVQDIKDAFILA